MDANDRGRGSGGGRSGGAGGGGGAGGNTIKGPHSALTDYLQELGVSEHFRERRRAEAAERAQQLLGQQERAPTGNATEQSADPAVAADLQNEENAAAEADVGTSSRPMRTRARATTAVAVPSAEPAVEMAALDLEEPLAVNAKKGKKGKGKRKKDDDSDDEADYNDGLNKSSARKGGRMKSCEICGKRFLLRGEHDETEKLLCVMCRKSVDKSFGEKGAVAKRARETLASAGPAKPQKRKMKKTADGLLEYEPGLPSLQDLCVRAIAKHLDQVDSFGDISAQSLNRLCRIISKMRVLDESTLSLFLGAEKNAVTLYDCTKISRNGLQRIVNECPQIQALDLEYCGRLDSSGLIDFGSRLPFLTSLRIEGAFLVKDSAWAMLFRTCARRLTSLKVRFVGFGPVATRALAIHCMQLVELRISECIDFDDDCLAILAVPITDYEEEEQETERVLRLLNERSKKGKAVSVGSPKDYTGPIPSWQPLSCLQSLDLARPHKPMSSQTTARVIRTVGSQLRVLDLSGFKDIDDSFLLNALDANCQNLQELYLNECNGISPAAMAQFFASQRGKAMVANKGYRCVGLERCYMLTDSVIQELVLHSGATLTWLNINSVDDNLSNYGLLALAGSIYNRTTDPESGTTQYVLAEQTSGCVNLEELDLSWVRCTADAVLEDVLATCKKLETIKAYGCPDITAFAPKRPGLRYIGRECDTL